MNGLFLDDCRNPETVTWLPLPLENVFWIVVRNYDEFVDYIETKGVPEVVSFDHDLAHEHYDALFEKPIQHVSSYDNFEEKTGYHCAKYLVEYCVENKTDIPKEIYIHTMNPIGREKILSLFRMYEKYCKKGE